jgi:undecaprenyl-diphosphatase
MNINISRVFADNKYINKFKENHPKTTNFIQQRISRSGHKGLWFTIGIILSAVSFFYFLALTQDILAHEPFVQADVRIMNLITGFRDLPTANVFLFFTYLGSWPIVMSLEAIVLIVLFLLNKRRLALFSFFSVIMTEGVYNILKLIIHRTRPDVGYSLIPRNGFSFPSGHATLSIVFYGLLGYLIYRVCKKWWQKLLVIISTLVMVYLIGFSRMYLGVHWSSDILAGWAVGLSILILTIALLVERERFIPIEKKISILPMKTIVVTAVVLFLLEGLFIGYYYKKHPLEQRPPIAQEEKVTLSSFDNLLGAITLPSFHKFSETITGKNMEPVSLIVVASPDELNKVFEKAGWFIADRGVDKIWKLGFAAYLNQSYPSAPVSPTFLKSERETIAFEKPTDLNTARQRHHTRFWLTNYSVNGTPVWIATASFDSGLRYFITHEIKPDIDTERDFIKGELVNTGLVKNIKEIQLVPPLKGTNQGGDRFFTDGKAYVMVLSQ